MDEWRPHPHLRVRRDGPVQTVTLSNTARRNAQTPSMWLALADLAANLDSRVRVVVFDADGPSFSSGIDLAMLDPVGITGELSLLDVGRRGPDAASQAIEPLQRGFAAWAQLDAIVVASVKGYAIGAGFQLALAADLRIVSDDVQFAMRETSLGLVPDLAGTRTLVDVVGHARALEICLTGRFIDAGEAVATGLAMTSVPAPDLSAATSDLVASLLATPEAAARELKRLLREALTGGPGDQLRRERDAQGRLLNRMATPPSAPEA